MTNLNYEISVLISTSVLKYMNKNSCKSISIFLETGRNSKWFVIISSVAAIIYKYRKCLPKTHVRIKERK
jgi:hypothetical protein